MANDRKSHEKDLQLEISYELLLSIEKIFYSRLKSS